VQTLNKVFYGVSNVIFLCISLGNYIVFWFVTSDVPVYITVGEMKLVICLNVVLLLTAVSLTICVGKRKRLSVFLTIWTVVILYLWFFIADEMTLYSEFRYYELIVVSNIVCLILALILFTVCNLKIIINRRS